ncbi:transporter substrate-binding domain-containing protein [Curvibacter sp. APW13]|uniref:substrate-binding periplasmic protein n=1 Tax=Curvibacter sp. APW13 TaxID=3077236 RepID=UPI0028DDD9E6|nr:transporter substrate-binding domain-containing protein [Curvibacter sp. APW13]MDT8989763.1 transporter substrate-binding domain-containing protein [Curvibacter sp. APW13]
MIGFGAGAGWARELRIVTIESAPFGFFAEDGKPTGMMFEIGNLIATEAGYASTNRIEPYQRTALSVVRGDADFVLRYGNADLAEGAIAVTRVLGLPTIVVGRAPNAWRSLAELAGKTVGVPRGGRFDPAFDADPRIQKYEVNDYAQTMRMLMRDRLDAGIGSSVGLYYNAIKLGIAKEQLGPPLVLSTQYFELFFCKANADPTVLQALREAVQRLEKRNAIRAVVDKYLHGYPWALTSR